MSNLTDGPPSPDLAALAVDLRGLVGRLKRRLREQADTGDLSPSQTDALLRLHGEGPMTVTALAASERVRPQSMGATVTALEAAGHVARRPDPDDGRQSIVSLTPACELMIKEGRAARQDWLIRAMQTALTPAEQAQLAVAVDLLKRMAEV
jgi:DNA-binding MarR family transcriptional regulator